MSGPILLAGTNERSKVIRTGRAAIRRGLRSGDLTLEVVLRERIEPVAGVPLFEIVTWRRGWGKDNQRLIGARAIRDRINLAVRAGDAPGRTIDWLIQLDETTCANRRVFAA